MNVAADTGFADAMDWRAALRERFGGRVRLGEPLARHTSFRIGGPADAWIDVESPLELSDLLRRTGALGVPVFLLGSGTNVLVSDRGVRGVVATLGAGFGGVEWTVTGSDALVRAGAAVPFKKLVTAAVERGLSGLEFGEGIPGSVGGGLTMNAGAFGGEIGRVVEVLEGVHADGRLARLDRAELAFAYRRLELPPGFVITAVSLRLRPGEPGELRERVTSARERRKRSQPLGF
ncbi:MAG: UDP-N-acetylmuramate dehydrogenase, partial [Candidatus Binatota bacterium]|nr:UDP-N-acetylmuramate dehydrogenase [Candidatus Binatota bacterium]